MEIGQLCKNSEGDPAKPGLAATTCWEHKKVPDSFFIPLNICPTPFLLGKLVSASSWKPDGKPCPITKIVDGSGILTYWHENGKKEYECNFKESNARD